MAWEKRKECKLNEAIAGIVEGKIKRGEKMQTNRQ